MCPNCRAFITTDDRICPYCQTKVGPRAVDRRNPGEILGGLIPQARFTTTVILLIHFALFCADYIPNLLAPEGTSAGPGLSIYGMSLPWPYLVNGGEWWRLVTAGFFHGGILH